MENRLIKIGMLLFLMAILNACDKFEMRGFVVSYESVDERFDQSMDWNNTHPYREIILPTDNYHFFVMGDSHLGGTENFDFFINEAQKTNAAATIMNGDLTNGHNEDFERFFQHLPRQDSLVSFQITGNHDLYFHGWKQFYSLFGSSTYLFTVKSPNASDLFICLDSGSGTLGNKQIEWLKDILEKERPNHRRCVMFTHNNLFRARHTFSTNPQVEELYVLMDWCVKYNIDMVVGAHDHVRNVVHLGNTTYLTMDALLDNYDHAGFLKLFFNQGEIEFEFMNL
jgi:hypothetical protein